MNPQIKTFSTTLKLILLLLITSCTTLNNEKTPNSKYQYGLFSVNILSEEQEKTHVAKKIIIIDQESLLKSTRNIPAKIGTIFGIKYFFAERMMDKPVNIKVKITFPKKGLTNPLTQETDYTATTNNDLIVDPYNLSWSTFYQFEKGWEVVPGKWRFEVFINGAMQVDETFIVADEI